MILPYDELNGAEFSPTRQFRYALWRTWDASLPKVMFVGLNPSTANESFDDPTIKSVCRISRSNGYGGVYMTNCFPFVSTNPEDLIVVEKWRAQWKANDEWLIKARSLCKDVVFAWGNFEVVRTHGRDFELMQMFPDAKCLGLNKKGSPKHPLYCKSATDFVPYNPFFAKKDAGGQ